MVSEMRVPSSSSSSSTQMAVSWFPSQTRHPNYHQLLTDSVWLNANALLQVSVGWVVGILSLKDLLPAKSVDERCATCESTKPVN